MSDNTDDLLDELEMLESASQDMQEAVEEVSEKQDALAQASSAEDISAAMVSLEVAKTAQVAAEHSQAAVEAAIKMAHEQKAQVMELSDSNIAWRQSLRTAANDLKSAKNAIGIMLAASITFSLVAAGVIAWLYYSLDKKYTQLKGDVLDIIATENTLFNKNLTLKVDQLSSLIEALAADIQRLQGKTTSLETISSQAHSQSLTSQPEVTSSAEPTAQKALPETETTQNDERSPKAPVQAIEMDMTPVKTFLNGELQTLSEQQKSAFEKLEARIEAIVTAQQKIQSSALSKAASAQMAPVEVTSMGLTESQVKKLNGLVAAMSSQQTLLKSIQDTVQQQKPHFKSHAQTDKTLKSMNATLKQLTEQVRALKSQQSDIDQRVSGLQETTKQLIDQPEPYSYKLGEKK